MKLKFVVAAFSHKCWVSYLCETPKFGKIGAQAATPIYKKNYFYETIIIKLNNDLHFWLHLTASRGRFDNNRSILNYYINLITLIYHAINVWRQITVHHICDNKV